MARVVVVHGIGKQFRGPKTLLGAVGPALCDGVLIAGGPALAPGDVSCAFYGDVFREPGMRDADLPPWDESDVESDLEAELLAEWWQEAARIEPANVPAPGEEGSRGTMSYLASRPLRVGWVREALDALSGSSFFSRIPDRLLIAGLKQVKEYLTDAEVRKVVVGRVNAEIGPDTEVLVGHSLGSIVAYEALCANPYGPVRTLVTLGSPLGVQGIFNRLNPAPLGGVGAWPGGLERWTNIADTTDVVAVVRQLAARFAGPVEDGSVSNGNQMHDVTRYLTAAETGAAVAAGLTR